MKVIVRLDGAQVGMSSCRLRVQVRPFWQWAAANCAALPTANAGHYATSPVSAH